MVQAFSKSRWSTFERNGPVSRGKRAKYRRPARIPRVRMSLRQPALAFAEIAKLSPRALYHRPLGTAKHHDGVNRGVPPSVPPDLSSALVARRLHLTDFFLIFHKDSAETASAVGLSGNKRGRFELE